jgi:flavin reductase (DIM6/NTAB) family NADH-FMN oxidoreductase RutF
MDLVSATHRSISPSVLYFGTPVALISSLNQDGTVNLAPISSAWYLGRAAVLGVGQDSQTITNLRRHPACVINLPSADQHEAVERLAPLTGRTPVPSTKPAGYRYEPDKFTAAGLTAVAGTHVPVARVAECPVHLEAVVEAIHPPRQEGFAIVETRVIHIHAADHLIHPGTDHVDTDRWRPLFYVFRHYYGLGTDLGHNFRAEH